MTRQSESMLSLVRKHTQHRCWRCGVFDPPTLDTMITDRKHLVSAEVQKLMGRYEGGTR